mgnify:CR=1 FL=1
MLKELRSLMPQEDYLYYGDSSFAPYGVKTKEEITKRCRSICAFFISQGVKAVVIACNTATSACVKELRTLYPDLPIVGMEPALSRCRWQTSAACSCTRNTVYTEGKKSLNS